MAAFLTSTYSIRLLKIVMLSRPNFSKSLLSFVKDSTYVINIPLIILSFGAIFLGYLTNELFLAYGSTFYLNSIFFHPYNFNSLFDASFYGSKLALLPLLFLFIINLILFITPSNRVSENTFNNNLNYNINNNFTHHKFTNYFYFLNHVKTFIYWIKHKGLIFSNYIYRYIDKGFLEFFGPYGGFKLFHFKGFYIELLSTGFIPHYALIKIISLFIIIKNILLIKLNVIIILLLLLSFIL